MPRSRLLPALCCAALLIAPLAGCVGSGETAVVTDRPEPLPSTEDAPAPDAAPVDASASLEAALDTVHAGRFDQGRMWTFEDPPLDYFESEYGFRPDAGWLEKARLGALRFATYCSASFVSPRGLILTNHHCARESITEVSGPDEDLLQNGFYAETRNEEREVEDLYVDQVVSIRDVTDSLEAAVAGVESNELEAITEARQQASTRLEERLTQQAKRRDTTLRVRVVRLYDGARYSAYTLHRYHDVRLVMAPERALGFYGGTEDNFTYPRYALDVSFFRAYTPDGTPLEDNAYFSWSPSGAQEDTPVFVVGNPGSTSRLATVSQLQFRRDFALPQQLQTLESRASILDDYIEAHPQEAEEYDLENQYFSLENAIKATRGELEGLRDPYLLARRRAAEEALRDSIRARDSLQERYDRTLREIEQLQRAKETTARQAEAFTGFLSESLGSHLLARALYGYYYGLIRRRPGVPEDALKSIRQQALSVKDWPEPLERQYIAARFRQMREALGAADPTVRRLLQGRTPEAIANQLVDESALIDSTGFAPLLEEGYLQSGDPSLRVIEPIASLFLELNRQQQDFASGEATLGARLSSARLAVQDRSELSPDATSSLRLSDGRVKGYEYNGTRASAFTTFYGLYDHYYSYRLAEGGPGAWDLPERWLTPPPAFDRATHLDLVSTNDIAGGNSGSPLLNENLEVVGVVFDSNVEALPNTFVYRSRAGRTISVDARGILEALEDLYEADRLVGEITGSIRASAAEETGAASE